MPKLSVIVPVYKVEAYLSECLDSLVGQTLQDLEIILIDDGSPDNSGFICDLYAEKDSRIRILHQQNKGVSAARNAGLCIATGEYIGFVDPDDYVSSEMYETLITEADNNHCEIAICGFVNCSETGEHVNDSGVPSGVYSKEELISSIYGMPNPFHGSMCNKIFSSKLLNGLFFDETVAIGEDWLLLYECYLKTEKAVAVLECFYSVRMRNNSATRKYTAEVYINKLKTYLRLYDYSFKQKKEIQRKATDKIMDACYMNKMAIIEQDYDRKSIAFVNHYFRSISISAFFKGNLSAKKAISYFIQGLKY